MLDPTENIRRTIVTLLNTKVASNNEDVERQRLKKEYNQVWNTEEFQEVFVIEAFMSPYVRVVRKSDDVKGTIMFQHAPRFYFNFQSD